MSLLDSSQKRCDFLVDAIAGLELGDRVDVLCGRAEVLAHHPDHRGRYPLVVSRSFGAPAVTAECAVGFLSGIGARLVVSEPPDEHDDRWPPEGLAGLGLVAEPRIETTGGTVQPLAVVAPVGDAFPRRDGVPAKRPLF